MPLLSSLNYILRHISATAPPGRDHADSFLFRGRAFDLTFVFIDAAGPGVTSGRARRRYFWRRYLARSPMPRLRAFDDIIDDAYGDELSRSLAGRD